ncbi:MAG: PEP-CTERM sorting domain-containing protein [Lentisphaeraceae bacterium]|nr:PEP-CTERM sorting domain-containing protein [Lentisphaeraceae bacterium]
MKAIVFIALVSLTSVLSAAPVDLSSWTKKDYNFNLQPPSNWVLSNNNNTVTQVENSDPSVFLNGVDQSNFSMNGTIRVNQTGDNDLIGFVFGYQDSSNFYVFDWKQDPQVYANTTAQEGFSIKKISANQESDLSAADFWSSSNTASMTNLESSYGAGKGWQDNVFYDFELNFAPGLFSIKVTDGNNVLWDVTVNDNSFNSGQFGFYNFSQAQVEYAGINQVTPEPSSYALMLLGLIGLVAFSRRRQQAVA